MRQFPRSTGFRPKYKAEVPRLRVTLQSLEGDVIVSLLLFRLSLPRMNEFTIHQSELRFSEFIHVCRWAIGYSSWIRIFFWPARAWVFSWTKRTTFPFHFSLLCSPSACQCRALPWRQNILGQSYAKNESLVSSIVKQIEHGGTIFGGDYAFSCSLSNDDRAWCWCFCWW